MKSYLRIGILAILALSVPFTYELFQEIFYSTLFAIPDMNTAAAYRFIDSNPSFLDAIFCLTVLPLYYLIYRLIVGKVKPALPLERKKFTAVSLLVCLVLSLGLGGLSILWFDVVDGYLQDSVFAESEEEFYDAFAYDIEEAYLWPFLSIVLIGPLVEEFLFRGIMFSLLAGIRVGWFAILISGVAFGLWHEIPIQVVYTGIMGIGLGVVYQATRNLWFPIVIHVINNFLSRPPAFMDTEAVYIAIEWIQRLAIVPAIVILIWMLRSLHRESAAARRALASAESEPVQAEPSA